MKLIEALREIVGPKGMVTGQDVAARPNFSWGQGSCPARAIVRPATTDEVSRVLALCNAHGQPIVPWGGLTGLVNGTTCEPGDIVLSLDRMSAIEHIDAEAGTMTVQAGAILQKVQESAAEAGWQFAVDFGGRGSAQVGGVISTNAGGNSVVRYGMMREQVLGLEAVLADGTVIRSMNEMLKNNAGYDLKHLFIGSEGTLGIVTRAVLRLRPSSRTTQTAFVALDRFEDVAGLLRRLGTDLEGKLSAFEVMWRNHYSYLVDVTGRHPAFLPTDHPFYVLIEAEGADLERTEEQFMAVLGALMEEGHVADALVAQSGQQAEQFWKLRDDIDGLVGSLKPVAVYDVSLPIREMERYVERVERELAERVPEARLVTFGHLGDGNIHLGVGPAPDKKIIDGIVYGELAGIGGSVSAEHGIGLDKKEYLHCSRSEAEIELMRSIKSTLDPRHILNPGKVF